MNIEKPIRRYSPIKVVSIIKESHIEQEVSGIKVFLRRLFNRQQEKFFIILQVILHPVKDLTIGTILTDSQHSLFIVTSCGTDRKQKGMAGQITQISSLAAYESPHTLIQKGTELAVYGFAMAEENKK